MKSKMILLHARQNNVGFNRVRPMQYMSLFLIFLGEFSIVRVSKEACALIRRRQFKSLLPINLSRFAIIIAANAMNWMLAILGPMYKFGDFANYLLGIFMINLMMYCVFYIIMKVSKFEYLMVGILQILLFRIGTI